MSLLRAALLPVALGATGTLRLSDHYTAWWDDAWGPTRPTPSVNRAVIEYFPAASFTRSGGVRITVAAWDRHTLR
jgi:hypothetical protein